jgi:DNA-binding transcriptional ArsR family regulator
LRASWTRDTSGLRTYETYVELLDATDHADLFDVCQYPWQDGLVPKTLPTIDMSSPICCSPVAAGPLDDDAALEIALRLKALADPVRVKLVSLLFSSNDGAVCSCDLATAVGVTESTVSHHLSQLRRAGLVESERRGMNVYHRPRREALVALCTVLDPNCCR